MASTYPVIDGRVQAPHLEINVVEHCNLSCRSCSHVSPVLPERTLDPADIYRDLAKLSRHYHARWFSLLGGEPLLHPDLPGVIAAVRRTGVADAICLRTNGRLLPSAETELWQAVDRVDVSLYPGRELSGDEQLECRRRAEENGVRLNLSAVGEFRESYSELGTDDAGLVRAIYESCLIVHRWRCHTVADGRFYKCPQSYFVPKMLDACAGNPDADSILIEDTTTFGQDLLAYLDSSEPLASCGNCLGTAGRRFPHTQVRRVEFRGRQERAAEELVDAAFLSPVKRLPSRARIAGAVRAGITRRRRSPPPLPSRRRRSA